MKKFTKIALALALVLGFSACGANKEAKPADSKEEVKTEETSKKKTAQLKSV